MSLESRIEEFFAKCVQIIHDEITRSLAYLGEQCVSRIKDRSQEESWIDHTGNLRSSIGYAIYDHGTEIIEGMFSGTTEGASVGQQMLSELANLYSETYALVVVAGMEYAEFVEAHDNKDVLASTKLWADGKINDVLEMAKKRAEDKINSLTV